MIRDEIHDGFGYTTLALAGAPRLRPSKRLFMAPLTPSRSAYPDERQPLAVELGRQRDLFGPQASMPDATPRLRRMSETVHMANSFAN